jgi:hypothetical protein
MSNVKLSWKECSEHGANRSCGGLNHDTTVARPGKAELIGEGCAIIGIPKPSASTMLLSEVLLNPLWPTASVVGDAGGRASAATFPIYHDYNKQTSDRTMSSDNGG